MISFLRRAEAVAMHDRDLQSTTQVFISLFVYVSHVCVRADTFLPPPVS